MNMPTIVSTPGSSGGRPDTVTPKTTSDRPLCRASSTDHAPYRIAPRVNRRVRDRSPSAEVSSGPRFDLALDDARNSPVASVSSKPSRPSGVGEVKPASVRRQ